MTSVPRLFVLSSRGKWTSAGGIVVDRAGRVALVRERGRPGWALPKGRLEPGESLDAAALREVREETGIRARLAGYVGVYEGKRRFVHYFLMEVVHVQARPDGDEIEEVRFVAAARATELLRSRRDRAALGAALGRAAIRSATRARGG
jgi:8-oxo-dGTP pyrophosphatase MutT (NUDIX family)